MTRAYFRELASAPLPSTTARADDERAAGPLLALLAAADVEVSPAPPLLQAGAESEAHLFRSAMAELAQRDPSLYARRLDELAFLVNVLSAGSRKDGGAYRPADAVEDAVHACNVGLQTACTSRATTDAVEVLTNVSADRLFRIGWRITQPRGA